MVDIVTGGAGFIGSHLVDRLLAAGRRVRVLDIKHDTPNLDQHSDNKNLNYRRIDIGKDYFEDLFEDAEHVYHLAALADIIPSIQQPEQYFRTNVTGTLKVLEAARKAKVKRVIYAASSSCYDPECYKPTSEKCNIAPQYPYALTKYLGEQLVMHWSQVYGLNAVSLRLFNVYGPRSRTTGAYGAVFGVFLAQLLAGKPLTIVYPGTQSRDFVYVSDVVEAFLKAAYGKWVNAIFNVGTGDSISINHLAGLLKSPHENIYVPTRPGEPAMTCADITKIRTNLNWEPTVGIEEGIARMLENIHYWKDAPVWTEESIAEATREWFLNLGNRSDG